MIRIHQNARTFPTLKDYIYTLIIFGLILTFASSVFLGGNPSASADLGFSATVTSIILSVIAILMTLFESMRGGSATEKITQTSEDIKKSTDELQGTISILQNVSQKLDNVDLMEMQNKISNSHSVLTNMMDKMDSIASKQPDTKVLDNLGESSLHNQIISLFDEGEPPMQLLYFIHKMDKNEKLSSQLMPYLRGRHDSKSMANYEAGEWVGYVRLFTRLDVLKTRKGGFVLTTPISEDIVSKFDKANFEEIDTFFESR